MIVYHKVQDVHYLVVELVVGVDLQTIKKHCQMDEV